MYHRGNWGMPTTKNQSTCQHIDPETPSNPGSPATPAKKWLPITNVMLKTLQNLKN